MEKVVYVNSPELLEACVGALAGVRILGLDTETTGLSDDDNAEISLIQLAVGQEPNIQVWVIDCMCKLDLRPIREIAFDVDVCKVIHFANFDTVMLKKCLGWTVRNVWCTFSAEKRHTGLRRGLRLADLAKKYFDVELDKSFQGSDWASRPLSEDQIRYAALDAAMVLRVFYRQRELGLNGGYDEIAKANYKPASKEWLPADGGLRKRSDKIADWDAEMTELINWFYALSLPTEPFWLREGHFVSSPQIWYASLRAEIAQGYLAPRARTGALRADLNAFRRYMSLKEE
ncbi:MAG: hypothetical protein RMM17_01500 [Acidobacteriota bacterium]|nr:hypothetical protein [Blastocatellia bacterium]MDW8411345.1 hypothetical protein [Acidobacteriota bacterium]